MPPEPQTPPTGSQSETASLPKVPGYFIIWSIFQFQFPFFITGTKLDFNKVATVFLL